MKTGSVKLTAMSINFMFLREIDFARKQEFMNSTQKQVLKGYLLIISLATVVPLLVEIPSSWFSNKRNFLNVYGVKFGWFWTGVLCILMIYNAPGPKRSLAWFRLGLATIYFLIVSQIIHLVFRSIGSCDDPSLLTMNECKQQHGLWQGFDISGHVFILLHSSLTLIEEALVLNIGFVLQLVVGMSKIFPFI